MEDEDLLAQLSYHRKEYLRLSTLAGVKGFAQPLVADKSFSNEKWLHFVAEFSQDFFSVHQPSGTFTFCSPSISRFGYKPENVIGKSIYQFVHPGDLGIVADHQATRDGNPVRYRFMADGGEWKWVETTSKLCHIDGGDPYIVSVTRDIGYQKIEEDKIRSMATRLDEANKLLEDLVMLDPLTEIGNRRHFFTRLETMVLEAERGRPLSVILIDVDNFKSFNDNFGHQAGDEALRQVAQGLQKAVRKIDCLARYGGEEFVVASANVFQGAIVFSEKMRRAVESIENKHRRITVSMGLAEYCKGDNVQALVAKADHALYEAKSAGKNRIVTYK